MVETTQRRRRVRGDRLACALMTALFLLVPFAGRAADPDPVKLGRSLYRVYCARCHGETGKGDGPTAAYLTAEPADLTRVAHRNGGKFPAQRLREIIDGREAVRGHGDREMPLWGMTFQDWNADRGQEDAVQGKIDQLLAYLETIQKK